jgi:hypothetical protein
MNSMRSTFEDVVCGEFHGRLFPVELEFVVIVELFWHPSQSQRISNQSVSVAQSLTGIDNRMLPLSVATQASVRFNQIQTKHHGSNPTIGYNITPPMV